jgi:hypothetical protein
VILQLLAMAALVGYVSMAAFVACYVAGSHSYRREWDRRRNIFERLAIILAATLTGLFWPFFVSFDID